MFRKFGSERIFDGKDWLPKDSVLITTNAGKIEAIVSKENAGDDIEMQPGIILPGFVNCHVHLELSHMRGKIAAGKGLVNFLLEVISGRNSAADEIHNSMVSAQQEMWDQGIIAAGDICNTTQSLDIKLNSPIRWFNFIELANMFDSRVDEAFDRYTPILEAFTNAEHNGSLIDSTLVAHAPFSVSPLSFQRIAAINRAKTISLHSQESQAENELYKKGTGDFLRLYHFFGLNSSPIPATNTSSLQAVLSNFNHQQLILVHNTFITGDDIHFAKKYSKSHDLQLWFCLCPNANLYIEDHLPPVVEMWEAGLPLVIGTDSYASNYQLSIAAEIRTLVNSFPGIPLKDILRWGTYNGASALGIDSEAGSFSPGTTPGVILMDEDFKVSRIF